MASGRGFFDGLVKGPVLNPTTLPKRGRLDPERILEDAPDNVKVPVAIWSPTARLSKIDFVARDAERRPELAKRIQWVSRDRGDGAGYDILSFNHDGSERLIEVKTTGLGKYFPFNVTANEVRCSEARPKAFNLYRVFKFGESPRLYMLPPTRATPDVKDVHNAFRAVEDEREPIEPSRTLMRRPFNHPEKQRFEVCFSAPG